MRHLAAAALLCCSCATSRGAAGQAALATALAAKPLVEQAYTPWERFVGDEVARCRMELPPAEHTRAEFDACIGPAIEHERSVLPALELYHASSLALYVALTTEQTGDEILAARRELARAVANLVTAIPAVDRQIERVKDALGRAAAR